MQVFINSNHNQILVTISVRYLLLLTQGRFKAITIVTFNGEVLELADQITKLTKILISSRFLIADLYFGP